MAEAKTFKLKWENYKEQSVSHWPSIGRHILAQYDKEYIVVYQAFCPEIADYAVQNGKFGGMRYSFTRMTWIKTNFLWMMYRSNWAQKKNQNRILAIYLSIEGFDQILKFSRGNGIRPEGRTPGNVRIQWDPDHDPKGVNQRRRAVQLGIKGIPLERFHEQYIQHIEDITEMVHQQRQHLLKNELHMLQTPAERVYTPSDESICRHILLDDFHHTKKTAKTDETVHDFEVNDNIEMRNGFDNYNVTDCKELRNTLLTKPVFSGDKKDVIVCLGGSFNPVHEGHIKMLLSALNWLNNNANYNVVAARLAVAPDSYIEKKCKRKSGRCIKAEHRIKMCELACRDQNKIKTHYTTTLSARNCGENVRQWENFKSAEIAVVLGADKAAFSNGHWKWKTKSKCLTICVGRKGQTEAVSKAYAEEFKEKFETNPNFILVEDEIDDINSTEIRRQLNEAEYDIKYDENDQINKETNGKHSSMKTHQTCKTMIDKSNDVEDRLVPFSWEDIPDRKQESIHLNKDHTEIHLCYQTKEENIPNKYDRHETADDVPALPDDLKTHKHTCICKHTTDQPFSDSKDFQQEKYGAPMKTSFTRNTKFEDTLNVLHNKKDVGIGKPSREHVIDNLVTKGWIARPVGDYILEKFFDLYL